ncbi:helix-turn-helix domain-containing protein [Paracoccus benzoatiresistens]|uniref:Helix-turn-helix transcriptional regulator n=1 Tax=Paracoccus benzoatiresistens TaxID=2997341 RepID=A0ABT4J5Q2_9RHOB|nr:helix-turn-helix transcriptional regulator [Paracoccus sp. EF6]MCZ0962401.1 helix-turn-helix transcriptional regulator [Paracoccus sp. EF6]
MEFNDMISKDQHPPRDEHPGSFIRELRKANPAGAELLNRNRARANIARSLRKMRKAQGMTQGQVSEASGMTQPMISRLESPLGSMPTLDSVMRYVTACNGHLSMDFRLEQEAGGKEDAPQYSTASLV